VSYFREISRALSYCGPRGVVHVIGARLRGRVVASYPVVGGVLQGASVLEIGGPSALFRSDNLVPVYDRAASIDNVNYAGATLWEADLKDGGTYAPEGQVLGTQWLREATELDDMGPYDVVISSHTIEHTANPLRALRSWRNATKPGGWLVLVVPHLDGTFDHRRPVTTLQHLHDDEAAAAMEDDTTHVDEILGLHDVDRDPGLPSHDDLHDRVARNVATRSMHHHVFDSRTVWQMVAASGWSPRAVEARWPHDILLLACNDDSVVELPDRIRSPFPSDRQP
jgi:SAM-dependent methyltransferase